MSYKILVLEDEMPLQHAIKKKLKQEGFVVVPVQTVQCAFNYLIDHGGIDIIWVDHYLRGAETGLEFVSEIKKDDRWKDIPIVVVSNTASPENVESYKALGINKYFVKSDFRLDNIIVEINAILNKN